MSEDNSAFTVNLEAWQEAVQFERLLNHAVRNDWVVYAKRPFGGPKQVLKYLARYTHRVAISNHRLLRMECGRVTFRYKDYANGQQSKTMTLDGSEFLRRFLLHVLPKGFVRIRHYGLLSNRDRNAKLDKCRELLGVACTDQPPEANDLLASDAVEIDATGAPTCPACQTGRLIIIETLLAKAHPCCARPHFLTARAPRPEFADTS